jgi:NAD(P)-dependent dehydrogenase (short-subunit alcohol dehydrogenase family)
MQSGWSWVIDVKKAGIRVNEINSGPVRTPFRLDFTG